MIKQISCFEGRAIEMTEKVCGKITLRQNSGFAGKWMLYPLAKPDTSGSSSFPQVGQSWEELDSTCGILCHNHHKTTAGRHSLMCHTHCNTCTQCIASGKSSLQPSSLE